MGFTPVDYETWERREFLEYFKQTAVYMTVQMDITKLSGGLKQRGPRLVQDYAEAEVCGRLHCDQVLPENICGISIVPATHFTSFSFGGSPKEDSTPFARGVQAL